MDDCMFKNVTPNLNCSLCPDAIREICEQDFSESIKNIIALAVTETRYLIWRDFYNDYIYKLKDAITEQMDLATDDRIEVLNAIEKHKLKEEQAKRKEESGS